MDRYTARINLHGNTCREREANRFKTKLNNILPDSLSCKAVKLNGVDTSLIVNSTEKSYIKEFQSFPDQIILSGDYIEWSNRTWLIYECDADDEIYTNGKMYECNYTLYWQNEKGEMVNRPSYIVNASTYNNGESANSVLTSLTNQFMVWMPLDDETYKIRNGKRIFIDNYSDSPYCYKLTRPDNVSMKFGGKGTTYYIFTQIEPDKDKDKQITLEDGTKVWIADYISPTHTPPEPTIPTDVLATISGRTDLNVGYSRTYSVTFKDADGNSLTDVIYSWNIVSSFNSKITSTESNGKITLTINDQTLVGQTFKLQVIVDGNVLSEITIKVNQSLY